MKIFLGILGGLIVFALLIFAFGWFGVGYTKTVGKAQQNADREVFEQTQSYVEGKRQELTKYRLEYMQDTSQVDRNALRITILSDFANFDENKLPPDLKAFLDSLKE